MGIHSRCEFPGRNSHPVAHWAVSEMRVWLRRMLINARVYANEYARARKQDVGPVKSVSQGKVER